MPMDAHYEDVIEQMLHDRAIDTLAQELHVDTAVIRGIYERHLIRLRSIARVRDYLPVLVARHTRIALRRLRIGD
ncbi:MAG TPA: DUF3562 domain-containing protein [Casimicrobiaceae bacterium]|nr:DUF3562 domain-containing protein [Casimicrobiaceae bacterium]